MIKSWKSFASHLIPLSVYAVKWVWNTCIQPKVLKLSTEATHPTYPVSRITPNMCIVRLLRALVPSQSAQTTWYIFLLVSVELFNPPLCLSSNIKIGHVSGYVIVFYGFFKNPKSVSVGRDNIHVLAFVNATIRLPLEGIVDFSHWLAGFLIRKNRQFNHHRRGRAGCPRGIIYASINWS